jgi:hypothetical protein
MSIVPFGHSCVSVAKLRGDDTHRHAFHSEATRVGMPQDMKRNRRRDVRSGARFSHRPELVGTLPRPPADARKDQCITQHAVDGIFKEPTALVAEGNVAGFAAFAAYDVNALGLAAVVAHAKGGELPKPSACEESGRHYGSEVYGRCIDEPQCLSVSEKPDLCRIDFPKWLDCFPGSPRCHTVFLVRIVQCSL